MSNSRRIMGGAFALLIFGGIAWYLINSRSACAVGIAGTAASITITGWGASEKCNAILSDPSILNEEYLTDPSMVYELTHDPAPTVACEYLISNLRYTVRDINMMIVGKILCNSLREEYERASVEHATDSQP